MKEKIGCDPRSPHATDPTYECDPRTNQWVPSAEIIKRDIIRAHPFLAAISNIQNKSLQQVLQLVENVGRQKSKQQKTKQKVVAVQKSKQKTKTTWQTTCKEMEEKCPMQTDLSGDNWCSLDKKDVFYYVKDGKRFCYGVEEIFSIIHLGFTARDTSYQVPPLRLQLPRDSYDRSSFTKEFFKAFREHIKKHGQTPKEPEVLYFLKYYMEFYNNRNIQQYLTDMDPPKVHLSNAIDNFLMAHEEIDINMNTSKWFWLAGKEPRNKRTYLFGWFIILFYLLFWFGYEQIKHTNQGFDRGTNLICAEDNLDFGEDDFGEEDDFGIRFRCEEDNLDFGDDFGEDFGIYFDKQGHCCCCFFCCCDWRDGERAKNR